MADSIHPAIRNATAAAYREAICERMGIVPFEHQRRYWAASEGLTLLDIPDIVGQKVLIPEGLLRPGDTILDERWINGQRNLVVPRMVGPREGGHARFLADLGAFKVGKSYGAALWTAGFAIVPNRRIALVGLEYDICEPEFSYLVEFLLSEQGMGMDYDKCVNNPQSGDMFLQLKNGTRFQARSWERKDSLKGKEIDVYLYCEAYQLPGIECFTGFSQNLRVRQGFALFATTPDRPWVGELHGLGYNHRSQNADPEWECVCSIGAEANPYSFDAKAKARDEKLMTREKFAIHYGGQLGDFVGRVFNYQRGERTFDVGSHPELFSDLSRGTIPENLRIPDGWEITGGADTGSFYTAVILLFSPEGDAFVVAEFPNYRYVGGLAERDEEVTIPAWAATITNRLAELGPERPGFWADANTQFKPELRHYGVNLLRNIATRETRTEIAREYFQHRKIYLAPWLKVLPFELENACWPEETTASGKYERVKDRDHTLDCVEHVLSKRPRGVISAPSARPGRWADQFAKRGQGGNVHLGRN